MRRIFGAVNSIHGCCWPASAMPAAPPLLTLLSKTSHYPRPARRSCSGMATFNMAGMANLADILLKII